MENRRVFIVNLLMFRIPFVRLVDIHPGDLAKTVEAVENYFVRPLGDQAITFQF